MAALVWIVTRQLRARWRSWALLAAIVGLAGAVVLTAAAGARRTDSAYSRFLVASKAADVLVAPDSTGFGGYYPALAKLPGVEAMAPVIGVQALPVGPRRDIAERARSMPQAINAFGAVVERPRFVSGRMPSPNRVDEVALDVHASRRVPRPRREQPSHWLRSSRQRRVSRPTGCRPFGRRSSASSSPATTRCRSISRRSSRSSMPAMRSSRNSGVPIEASTGSTCASGPACRRFNSVEQAEALAKKFPATGGDVYHRQFERPGRPDRACHPTRSHRAGHLRLPRRPHRPRAHRPDRAPATPGRRGTTSRRCGRSASITRQLWCVNLMQVGGRGRGRCAARGRRRRPCLSVHAARAGEDRRAQPRHGRRRRRVRHRLRLPSSSS